MRTYLAIIRDHSLSMQSIASAAKNDYNSTLQAVKSASQANNIDTQLTIIECGGGFRATTINKPIHLVEQISHYGTPGSNTPLFDSVDEANNRGIKTPLYVRGRTTHKFWICHFKS